MLKGIKKRFTRKKRTEKTQDSSGAVSEEKRVEQKANTNSTSETTSAGSTTIGAPILSAVPKSALSTTASIPASSALHNSTTRRSRGQEEKGSTISRHPPLRSVPQGPDTQTEISDTSVISSVRSEEHQVDFSPNMASNESHPTVENGSSLRPPVHIDTSAVSNRTGSAVNDDGNVARYEEAPDAVKSYDAIPVLKVSHLPRGGVTMETQAVGRVQFGIPPETIKDSMVKGYSVPAVYIVPVERFCREMGPALGINLAEFEFPCYYNFFIRGKRCTLVVDSDDAERNIRRVFSETLLGPAQFRRKTNPIPYVEEDFAPEFPREKIPDLAKELRHFRIMPGGNELNIERLIEFRHFETPGETGAHEMLGIPPPDDSDDALKDTSGSSGTSDTKVLDCAIEEATTASADPHAQRTPWTYSQARWIGDVATVWPQEATPEQIEKRECKRVEIFKMPGGTEYILHDIDENNHIVGKARFFGHVKVSESMAVAGFGGHNLLDDEMDEENVEEEKEEKQNIGPAPIAEDDEEDDDEMDDDAIEALLNKMVKPPTFHPPSFGVTVLGNSHGFDKSGSVSGYVLWINGRGVMIDPPPYSSATLEREGIRPRTIVGIILTHCHADHDAGAFQKVLTGSPVSVITTPTIYKSFIRKYAALSALSPALLRHSHRHKPAIIGRPLRFQGATFHFTYTLHSIPCVGFKVEWRGRSMVFTGDHFNSPPDIDKLQAQGVLSRGRADDLRNLPLQDTDLLLHEAGIPPLHTPLAVLMGLPQRVKRRLYVVHTSALPEDSELRVAPTGTQGTIRLDQMQRPGSTGERGFAMARQRSERGALTLEDESLYSSPWSSASNEYGAISEDFSDTASTSNAMESSFAHIAFQPPGQHRPSRVPQRNSLLGTNLAPPLVSLRPASSTDAWFILNLLSAVPFLTSLSYASTMEVLETARVDAYCQNDVVVPSSRRNHVLCVVWEGTCVEREKSLTTPSKSSRSSIAPLFPRIDENVQGNAGTVWHAGDWTGPIALQPERRLSGDSAFNSTHDIVAMSTEGVKVITVEFSDLHAILKSGSPLYRKYLERKNEQKQVESTPVESPQNSPTQLLLQEARKNLNVLELLNCNSALRKLSAVQKRHLESLAEGPVSFQPGERLWRAGAPVDRAFIVVAGTASFVPKRRNAGSVGLPSNSKLQQAERIPPAQPPQPSALEQELSKFTKMSLGESMRQDAIRAMQELGGNNDAEAEKPTEASLESGPHIQMDTLLARHAGGEEGLPSSLTEAHDYVKLSREFQKRADYLARTAGNAEQITYNPEFDGDDASEGGFSLDFENEHSRDGRDPKDRRLSLVRRRSSRARFANKVLGRLYSRRAFTGGLIFSRGHFLGDVSTMVAGLLSVDLDGDVAGRSNGDDAEGTPNYGFGGATSNPRRGSRRESVSDMVIHEQEGGEMIVHSSTLTAGKEGCVVLVFQKPSLIPFLDEYPGLLLSLLGTQVVV
uniref:Metallo-beta-lactamase domain-containing protein n=1 Tax=Grammatophora oceanica TaxID=210454 RepID=A0A7S1UTE9_9STRA|mmetsp:Transcript_22108/g.32915  ORF Transcript_22108/g.32915 Transcript_22108/m.32915 type:complete len:1472 (+) Transcript_22108:334-4749(+)|eukprot:CAMPEP_0194030424 /NCGR_PEP_ID=MMETSP0009_2-20130614/3913_1 /TAXON_ID=210454 /ORGANISM="Grammatophora oceanica, Strain CCMP 410" /LENGTH=1471 /DNA_ID=CAMNT_0038670371 /DNA_START=272 /DNA_END=4687 /DNA_ORIENTATION=-